MKIGLSIGIAAALSAGTALAEQATSYDYARSLARSEAAGAQQRTVIAIFKSGEQKAVKPAAKKEKRPTTCVCK